MRNKIGIIYSIDRENDVRVRYGDNAFFINPEALVKVMAFVLQIHIIILGFALYIG